MGLGLGLGWILVCGGGGTKDQLIFFSGHLKISEGTWI
jgi:hypothetical protein